MQSVDQHGGGGAGVSVGKAAPETLRVWVNTFLGESWEDAGEQIDDYAIADRRETYGSQVPAGVVVLTAGVDVQDDRLEVEVLGHGRVEESWSIKWHTIYDIWRPIITRCLG